MFEDVLRLFSCNLAKCTGDKEFTNHLTANWRLFVQPTWENVKDSFDKKKYESDNLKNSSIRAKTTWTMLIELGHFLCERWGETLINLVGQPSITSLEPSCNCIYADPTTKIIYQENIATAQGAQALSGLTWSTNYWPNFSLH